MTFSLVDNLIKTDYLLRIYSAIINNSSKERLNFQKKQALEYYKQGYSIIPITPKTKRAAIRWGCYQKVRANKEQIQRWFEKTVYDIAILTGKVSGIIHKAVEAIEDEAVRKNIKNTMKIKTGSSNLN
jgi:hypothetical protein